MPPSVVASLSKRIKCRSVARNELLRISPYSIFQPYDKHDDAESNICVGNVQAADAARHDAALVEVKPQGLNPPPNTSIMQSDGPCLSCSCSPVIPVHNRTISDSNAGRGLAVRSTACFAVALRCRNSAEVHAFCRSSPPNAFLGANAAQCITCALFQLYLKY